MPFVGLAEGKDVFERYLSVNSNFATLIPLHRGNATERLRGSIISRFFVCHRLLYDKLMRSTYNIA